jgi:hypothetical protein
MDVTVQEQPLPFFMFDDEEKPAKQVWPQIVDLFSNEIGPAKDWQDADIVGSMEDICKIFNEGFPGALFFTADAMRIPHERNEHNNKYYYLAKWK